MISGGGDEAQLSLFWATDCCEGCSQLSQSQKVLDLWPPAPSSAAVGGRMEELLCLSSFPKVPTPGGQREQAGAGDSTVSHRRGLSSHLLTNLRSVLESVILILNVSSRAWQVPNKK